jgi:2-oxoglutarate dehydrogenase E2 component (dihydrolipoamide succinyltransferase)
MADVIMPQMGESIAEGTVTKWLKNVGDTVERDEPLFEISTDKVDAEIPSPAAGVLREIRVPPGTTVPVNSVVGLIVEEGREEEGRKDASPAVPAVNYRLEDERPAEPAAPPEAAAPSGTASAAPSAPPPATLEPSPAAPEPRPVADQPQAAPVPSPEPESAPAEMTADELRQARSSPVVRRIAAEHRVDISAVPGTGIGGRVTKQDILGHIERGPGPSAPPSAPDSPGAPAPPRAASSPASGDRVEVVPMTPIRKKTAEHMILSKRTSAHVTTVFEVDMTRVDELRRKHKAAWEEKSGVRLTFMPFILKAVVDALKAFPVLNSRVDGDSIAYHRDVNLGVAVALDWGLIVPVIHNADEKNLLGLARAVNDLADRARAKTLQVTEVQGGTFTITNPGVFGSLFGTPIINQPQVGILGVGTIEKRPVVRDDAIAIRTMACIALTFDHRIVDGSDADRFMAHVKATLQEFDEAAL